MTAHIILPTCGGDRLLEPFCRSFVKFTNCPCRIYFVCNTPDSKAAWECHVWSQFLAEFGVDCTLLRFHEQIGYVRACNEGWKMAAAEPDDEVVVLNDDLVFEGDWLGPLRNELKEAALVGPGVKYLGMDGFGYTTPHQGGVYIEGWCFMAKARTLRDVAWIDYRRPGAPTIRRSQRWLFDPAFEPQFCEDCDLSLRVAAAGGNLRCVPLLIQHARSQTVRGDREPYWTKNREYLKAKWGFSS